MRMNELSFELCKRIIGDRFIEYYQGRDNEFMKYFLICSCITPDILRELCQYDNLYISSYDNYPTVVVRCSIPFWI